MYLLMLNKTIWGCERGTARQSRIQYSVAFKNGWQEQKLNAGGNGLTNSAEVIYP